MNGPAPGLTIAGLVSLLMLTMAATVPASPTTTTTTAGATMPKPPPTTTVIGDTPDFPAGAVGRDRPTIAARFLRNMREAGTLLEQATGARAGKLAAARERAALGVLTYTDDPAARHEAERVVADADRARLELRVAEVLEVVRELVPARMRDELGAELERRTVAELSRRRDRGRTR